MALEQQQVNVQEIQRLNDAITITLDAIRRVAPQLAMLQQQQLMQQMSPFGIGMGQVPYGVGQQQLGQFPILQHLLNQMQYGGGVGQFPILQQLLSQFGGGGGGGIGQHPLLQQLMSQMPYGGGGIGQHLFGMGGGFGQQFGGGYGQQFGGVPWQQQMQQPWGVPWQQQGSPFGNIGQRPF